VVTNDVTVADLDVASDHLPEGLLVLLVIEAGEPGCQALYRSLKLGMKINKPPQLIGEPGEGNLIIAPPSLQLLNATISEIHAS
jgi:hypothetical protein